MRKDKKQIYHAIGLMSGTSLDGLDIACCKFIWDRNWRFEIECATTIRYSKSWRARLAGAHHLNSDELLAMDVAYGEFVGKSCQAFIAKNKIRHLDLIASHGHTVFHQPRQGFTFQMGSGAAIHAITGLPVVYDFRSLDVILGGEGAPLVPVGDRTLFSQFDACLNLGGIANLSLERKRQRIAFDVCYANMGLNFLASLNGRDFDRDGRIAGTGRTDTILLEKLKGIYHATRRSRPSLAREGFESKVLPLLTNDLIPLENRMHTFCESIADEISWSLPLRGRKLRLLATGGGSLNPVLTALIRQKLDPTAHLEIPARQIIEFKEALIFAFLGVLRVRGEINVYRSVTGAQRDSCSGSVIGDR